MGRCALTMRLAALFIIAVLGSACVAVPLPSPATALPGPTTVAASPAPEATAEQAPAVTHACACVVLPVISGLTPEALPDPAAAGKAADEFLMDYQKTSGLNAVVRVELGGQTVLDKAYGYDFLPQDKPMTVDARMRIYHLSGSFMSCGPCSMLQEQGKLSVEDLVCQHIADCPAACLEGPYHPAPAHPHEWLAQLWQHSGDPRLG